MTRLQFLRTLAFHSQQGRCCYCEQPMWLTCPTAVSYTHLTLPTIYSV